MARLSTVLLPAGIALSPPQPSPALRRLPVRQPLGATLRLTLLLLAAAAPFGCATTPVPNDPVVTVKCPAIQPAEFAGWFDPGSVSGTTVALNGIANPANSLGFVDKPNCGFYRWSEQMFLWLTSPAPPVYGGGAHVFESPVFYDVSPLDSTLQRTLIPHTAGTFSNMSLRASKPGSHGLQVVQDRSGRSFDVEPPRFGPTGRQLILNQAGQPVEIGRATFGPGRQPIFVDTQGATIERPRPLIPKERDQELTVQKFVVERQPVFLSSSGNTVDVENGEADGAILMSQTGSLVYYSILVNDVFAFFLTGARNLQWPDNQFPTTPAQITQITSYASSHSTTIPDPQAMAVEIKMSWVEASKVFNINNYITTMATIPTYNQSDPNHWIRLGQKTVKMALVGVHFVGVTAGNVNNPNGHPELLWATFEHQTNAPSLTYPYRSTSGLKFVSPDFSKTWLFCAANPPASSLFNDPHMHQDPDPLHPGDIRSVGTYTISPSNTMRVTAWGAAANASPNPVYLPTAPFATAASAASNSEVILMNDGVRSLLNSADVRGNYLMTGSTWTINGGSNLTNFGNPGNVSTTDGMVVGTSQLANTTMETYQQGPFSWPHTSAFSAVNNNCLTSHCHTTNTTGVSHIYGDIKKLF